jgi:hypothetical protein
VRDQVVRYPVHGAAESVEVGRSVTVGAATHSERSLGKRCEGGVQGIERVTSAPRDVIAVMVSFLRSSCGRFNITHGIEDYVDDSPGPPWRGARQ